MAFDPEASADRMKVLAWQRRLASNHAIHVARNRATWPKATDTSPIKSPEFRSVEPAECSVDEVGGVFVNFQEEEDEMSVVLRLAYA